MLNPETLENLHFKDVFIGNGFDELINAINSTEDYLLALFENSTHNIIWITDDAEVGHSIFVKDTNGINKDKLLQIKNTEQKSLFLWHIDGVMFEKKSKCDCALQHDKILHLIEFKVNALNHSNATIEQHYDKACNQLSITFNLFKELYTKHGLNFWEIFDDVSALAVFDKTVPQNNAYQKSKYKEFLDQNQIKLYFDNILEV